MGTLSGEIMGTPSREIIGTLSGEIMGTLSGEIMGTLSREIMGTLSGEITGTLSREIMGTLSGEITLPFSFLPTSKFSLGICSSRRKFFAFEFLDSYTVNILGLQFFF